MSRWKEILRPLCTAAAAPKHSFITTPIFYVNAAPHIGHLYSAVLADAGHRWQRMKGARPAVFSTGTDEHGLKIQKAAAAQGCPPTELCDRVSHKFKDLFISANIDFTDYIRTTEERHVAVVEPFWEQLYDEGYIYKGEYEGWYSIPDETFLASSEVADDAELGTKVSLETGHPVEWCSEENYLFRLTAFRERLLQWINTEPYPIIPEVARKDVHRWVTHELTSDLSVSRPRSRLTWGIPVPNDSSQTIYVWLDALLNYLTVSKFPSGGHTWPATAHIVGKDILRFHAVFWPAFLMAAGLEPPRRIVTHAHWMMGRLKMSKSRGNVVDPEEQLAKFGVDAVRYFLLKEGSLSRDGDYSEERVAVLLNADLADTLGNLLQRVTAEKLNPDCFREVEREEPTTTAAHQEQLESEWNKISEDRKDRALIDHLKNLTEIVGENYDEYKFNTGIEEIMHCLYKTNQFIDRHKPWQLVKDPSQHSHLQVVLATAVESVRLCSCLLHPIIPHSSLLVLERLGVSKKERTVFPSSSDLDCQLGLVGKVGGVLRNVQIGGSPLFTKISLEN